MHTSALQEINADARLVFELASGIDSIDDLAERYGFQPEELRVLTERPNVRRAIKEKKKELDETGHTLASKAKLCFEDLLGDLYKKSKGDGVSLAALLSSTEFFRKVAGLDKQDVSVGDADKFSITINLGGSPAANQQNITVNVQSAQEQQTPKAYVYDAEATDVTDAFSFAVLPEYLTPDAFAQCLAEVALPEWFAQ